MIKKGKRLENRDNMMVFVLCCYDRILETGSVIEKRSLGNSQRKEGLGWGGGGSVYKMPVV